MEKSKWMIVIIILLIFPSCNEVILDPVQYKVIAHRGFWKEANGAENSLEGLLHAVNAGVDGVELDVCKTIDDSLVVTHGDKYCGYTISQTKFEILRNVHLSNGEVLPTLLEYLMYYEQIGESIELIIEIKQAGEEELVLKHIEKLKITSQVKLISFGWEICKKVKSLNSNIHVSYLNGDKSPFEINAAGLDGIAYTISTYKNNLKWLEDARELGLTTYIWAVNTESDFRWSARNHLEYVVTDYPREALHLREDYN